MNSRPNPSNEDRRKHKRAEDIFIVTYRLQAPIDVTVKAGDREYAGVAMDIGEGGMGVDVAQKIVPGTRLLLKFTMLNEFSPSEWDRQRAFEIGGEARYCQPTNKNSWRVGIIFDGMAAKDISFISEYVRIQELRKYEE